MKKFQYSLQTVLDYKEQMLDSVREEYARCQKQVQDKKLEIEEKKRHRSQILREFDEVKIRGAAADVYLMYSAMIDQIDDQIRFATEELEHLEKKAEKKKAELVDAKIDVSRFDQLKGRRIVEYNRAEQKEQETFIEEFVSHQNSTKTGVQA